MKRFAVLACAAGLVISLASTASAQLVFGSRTSLSGAGAGYYLDMGSLTLTRLWTQSANHRPNAFAADQTNGIIYNVDSARLSYWNYGAIGVTPTFVSANGGLFRTNGTTNTATGVDGLEFVNGTLYGWTNFGSTVYSDGIYSIVTSGTFAGLMQPVWLNDDVYDFEGLAYNPANGLFYGTNTRTAGGQPVGLYTIDALNNPNAVPQFVTGFDPALGLTSFDGLAIGDGSAWLTQYVNGTATDNSDDLLVISKYNLATGVFDNSIGVVIPSNSQVASGACWAPGALVAIPEPAALSFAAGAAMLVYRRRGR